MHEPLFKTFFNIVRKETLAQVSAKGKRSHQGKIICGLNKQKKIHTKIKKT